MLGLGLQLPRHQPIFQRFQGLLDLYPNAAFATGMRLLRADYSGGILRIIAYDGASQQGAADIMPYKIGDNYWVDFNSKLENLDATAIARGLTTNDTLADLCSVGVNNYDGLVPSWYDQSLNANHATQTNISNMPKLVDAGVLVEENGKPALTFSNSFFNSDYSGVSGEDIPFSMISVAQTNVDGANLTALSLDNSSNVSPFSYLGKIGSNFGLGLRDNLTVLKQATFGPNDNTQFLMSGICEGTTSSIYFNGITKVSSIDTNLGTITRNNITIGAMRGQSATVNYWNGKIQESILYPSDKSANRTGIESNINNAYNIY